jgi:hypothetical protein
MKATSIQHYGNPEQLALKGTADSSTAFVLGNKDYPLSNVPPQAMIRGVESARYHAKPVQVFPFEQSRMPTDLWNPPKPMVK